MSELWFITSIFSAAFLLNPKEWTKQNKMKRISPVDGGYGMKSARKDTTDNRTRKRDAVQPSGQWINREATRKIIINRFDYTLCNYWECRGWVGRKIKGYKRTWTVYIRQYPLFHLYYYYDYYFQSN